MEEQIIPHEYLKRDDYYETRSVNKGRSHKYCEYCGEIIPVGMPHKMHHFYPEFEAYATHIECTAAFMDSLKLTDDTRQYKFNLI